MANWDQRFLDLAKHIGTWSKDRSTKVGCVIVGPHNEIRSTGYNGFPRGVDDEADSRHLRPEKYLWTEHAERNAIYNAARIGVPLHNCRMYLTWFPCMDCARAIVQSGIMELVARSPDFRDAKWGVEFGSSMELFRESGVNVRFFAEETRSQAVTQGATG